MLFTSDSSISPGAIGNAQKFHDGIQVLIVNRHILHLFVNIDINPICIHSPMSVFYTPSTVCIQRL